jgi:hypothetical protein
MSFSTPVFGEYGNTVKGRDHNMFWSKRHSVVNWASYGTTTSGANTVYLRRPDENNARGLYIPETTYASMMLNTVCWDKTNTAVVHAFGTTGNEFYRASGGNVTMALTAATIGTNRTLTPTANTTVQALEMVVADSDSGELVYVYAETDLWWFNDNYKGLLGSQTIPAGATAALTVAE